MARTGAKWLHEQGLHVMAMIKVMWLVMGGAVKASLPVLGISDPDLQSFGYEQSDRSAAVSINTDDSRSPAEVFCDCRLCFSNGRRNSGRPSDQDRGTQWKRRISDMNEYIAYCGLDCEACEARLATVNNDDALRRRVAKEWSELNSAEITPEMINCSGCRIPGVKTPYCDFLCPIRQCAIGKQMETCGRCPEMNSCEKLSMITGNNADALRRLMEV